MRRLEVDEWAGIAMLVVCVGLGLPILLGAAEPQIAPVPWAALFVVTIATLVFSSLHDDTVPTTPRRAAYVVAVVGSWAVVATGTPTGLLSVLVVLVAACGPEIVTLRATFAVVTANSVVLTASWVHVGMRGWELATGVGFYILIQVATVLSMVAVRRERRLRQRLAETHVGLQAATVLLSESARAAERLRISRDLHDVLGHQLTVLSLELEAARHRDGEAATEHVERAHGVARALLADVRETVGALRTPSGDLAEALAGVGRGVPGLDVEVDVEPGVTLEEDQLAVFVRATQEIVTNALRHSGARRLRVEVRGVEGTVRLTASDDGRGVDRVVAGNGLRGLDERFSALGGSVDFDGSRGFTVTAQVPAA
jgi:signal transduction histidine kinase